MKWKFFVGAALVVGAALWKAGAPPLSIALGITLAAVLNLRQQAKLGKTKPKNTKTQARAVTRTVNP